MNGEFFDALRMLEQEKGIPQAYLIEKIENAISIAVKRDNPGAETVRVSIDPAKESFSVSLGKTVVCELLDPMNEILREEAYKYDKKADVGDMVDIPLETHDFGRIAAQTAKHVIRQGIREAERGQLMSEYQSKEHELVTALVSRVDHLRGLVTLEIGRSESILPKSEQVPGEVLKEGDRIKVYVSSAIDGEKGPKLMISRTHPGLVKRLFEMEVPEIYDGTVEIRAISREAGSRTKLAVSSKDPDVEARGACIGPKGSRVAKIVEELGGEKIDIVEYSEDPATFIKEALSPSDVISVEILNPEARTCRVIVPDSQLSLAIGNKGQNARLAAHLTGYKIDIKPESSLASLENAGE